MEQPTEQKDVKKTIVCEPSQFPDIYTNGILVHVSSQDVTLNLYAEAQDALNEGVERRYLGRIRMTTRQAWVMSEIILKSLKGLKDADESLIIPADVLERLKLTKEYDQFKEAVE